MRKQQSVVIIISDLIFNAIGIWLPFSVQSVYSLGQTTLLLQQPITENSYNNNNNNSSSSTKVVILAFDDSPKSQFILAKPILDKYGFKGSFFTVCNYVNNATAGLDHNYMTWQDIKTLQQQGHDIESHTMTHTNLKIKSIPSLEYEIGGSKKCLLDHGINSTVFSYPSSHGHSNATVVKMVSKYYDLARTADAPLAFLHCNGYKKEKDCRPFNNSNGKIGYENRYGIREWGHHPHTERYQLSTNRIVPSFNQSQMFSQFVKEVNSQENYNKNGCIVAIPIVVYHKILPGNIVYTPNKSHIDVNLFSSEMKYLHDNGFKVLKTSDLGYNQTNNHVYIKELNTSSNNSNAYAKNC